MGRLHKGPRKQITSTRVHPDVAERVQAEADRIGVPRSDLIAHMLCNDFGMPEYSPLRDLADQQQTQMPMTA